MKNKDGLVMCLKCKKEYSKCFCAYPIKSLVSWDNMLNFVKRLDNNAKVS